MSQRYNTKRPRPQDTELRILQKFRHFAEKFSSEPQSMREGLHIWGYKSFLVAVTYLSMKIHPKTCCISPLKVTVSLLNGSRKGAVEHISHSWGQCRGYMLTLQTLMYIKENNQTDRPIWNHARGTLTSWKGLLNWIALSNSITGKSALVQVIKQPEHGRTSTTEEQKLSSVQTNYD